MTSPARFHCPVMALTRTWPNAKSCRIFRSVRGSYLWLYQSAMKTNQNMRRFLGQLKTDGSALSPELSSVLDAGFVEEKGCVLLHQRHRTTESKSLRLILGGHNRLPNRCRIAIRALDSGQQTHWL
jgi:hypothetical protein